MFDNLISNIRNGFNAANATRKLVFEDKKLFAYPVLSAILVIIVAVAIFAAAFGIYFLANIQSRETPR